jgi:putative ABC transport system substrate-binding protein
MAARAQQLGRTRRIAVLMPYAESDPEIQTRMRAFRQELRKLGWTEGVNIQFDERWTADSMAQIRTSAANLLELKPDVVVAVGGRVIPVLLQLTRTVPIIVPGGSDPVASGWVESIRRPGGNLTGFAAFELSTIGKMVEMLRQIVPAISRVAMVYNPDNPNAALFARSFEASAEPLAIKPIIAHVHGLADIERAIEKIAEQANGGVIFPLDLTLSALLNQTLALVERHRLPAIYSERAFVTNGGLIFYGVDRVDIFRRSASYVDRVLRGEKPGDLPYQLPTKFELVINLQTARALGVTVPATLLATADEVIE